MSTAHSHDLIAVLGGPSYCRLELISAASREAWIHTEAGQTHFRETVFSLNWFRLEGHSIRV